MKVIQYRSGNQEGRGLRYRGEAGLIISCTFRQQGVIVCTGFVWLRIGSRDGM